jgi:hypothetical protein
MNANGFRSITVTLLLLAASVAIVAVASAGRAAVTDIREITVAIVDPQKTTPERNEFRARIANALMATVHDSGGQAITVHPVFVGGRDARLKLVGGNYDAALIIGEDRPFSLRRLNFVTLAGSMHAPNGVQPVSLVIGNAALDGRLRAAFAHLLSSEAKVEVPSAPGLAALGG